MHRTYLLFQDIDDFPQVVREHVALHNVRHRIHVFVLVRKLDIDAVRTGLAASKEVFGENSTNLL